MDWVQAETQAGRVSLDPAVGNLRDLSFDFGHRQIAPLHTAHWVGGDLPDDMPQVDRNLSGDFLCAPFGLSDVEPSPLHGWSANSPWTVNRADPDGFELTLDKPIMGASLTKSLKLAQDAPILYQTHVLQGGHSALTLAHHPMVRIRTRGWLSVSPKSATLTPDTPLVEGRNALMCPARVEGFNPVPATEGGTIDLSELPIAEGCEDFVTLVEQPRATLGWSTVIRETEDDLVFVLKDPRVLPVTMLWHSNGGRTDWPWDGKNTGVLGIEDGCAAGSAGHQGALAANPVSREGVPTAIPLGATVVIRHVIGAVPRPDGWTHVTDIHVAGSELVICNATGEIRLPFDPDFFAATSDRGTG